MFSNLTHCQCHNFKIINRFPSFQVMLHGMSKTDMINRRMESQTVRINGVVKAAVKSVKKVEKDFIFYDDLIGNGTEKVPFKLTRAILLSSNIG
jgi:hypothetical protein